MSLLTGWRLPLRMARRDALRNRGRSVLVVVMVALPVLGVTTADVLIQTASISGVESIDRRMGSADALVTVQQGIDEVQQPPDPDVGTGTVSGPDNAADAVMPTAEQVSEALGGARLLEIRAGGAEVPTEKGRGNVLVTEVDLTDPVTEGLFDLTSGRLPRTADEVVVNQALLDKGYAVGEPLEATNEDPSSASVQEPTIVGVAESTTYRNFPVAVGPLGAFGLTADITRSWLVDGGPVSWETVRALNAIGATVASRDVITNPPPASEVPPGVVESGLDDAVVAVILLIVVMALIEVVLLAGPAFAVGARKQQRSLALMAAAGGTPAQSRRVIVSSAIVLGAAAAVAGVALGIAAARLLVPVLQSLSGDWLGPFDVPWLHVLGVAAFGMLSAFLAAVVPAYIASRQDVVAVLAGRRGDRAPSLRSPLIGLVLLGVGVAGSVAGAGQGARVLGGGQPGGEVLIAASAIPAVLGMVLLVPVVLELLARISRRLPLVLRYAVRDAARHRTRTVPAVAAVAATVAGVVALGIGVTSDEAENRGLYSPSVAADVAIVTAYEEAHEGQGQGVNWEALRGVVEREVPDATITEQRGLLDGVGGFTEVRLPGGIYLDRAGAALGAAVMVSDDALPVGLVGVAADEVPAAEEMLRRGGVVAFVPAGSDVGSGSVRVIRSTYDPATGEDRGGERVDAPAVFVEVDGPAPVAVVSPAVATELGVAPETVSLAVSGSRLSEQQESDLDEGLAAVSEAASVYVERGYQADDETVIVQLVLLGLGAVLMLGGTLTATFLALSDARPDLATLAAVGAPPRTRRGVAAAYAAVVGLVGALLGAAVGFIPGIAVTFPLTTVTYTPEGSGPFLDIPWLLVLMLVVALPLLTSLIVGLFARSRLPLVARLD